MINLEETIGGKKSVALKERPTPDYGKTSLTYTLQVPTHISLGMEFEAEIKGNWWTFVHTIIIK